MHHLFHTIMVLLMWLCVYGYVCVYIFGYVCVHMFGYVCVYMFGYVYSKRQLTPTLFSDPALPPWAVKSLGNVIPGTGDRCVSDLHTCSNVYVYSDIYLGIYLLLL